MLACLFMEGNSVVKFKVEMEELKPIVCPVFWGNREKSLSVWGGNVLWLMVS